MQALRLDSPGRLAFIDMPEPQPPGPGEAVVRVHAVGICGTDLGGYRGTMPFFSYPRIPGHELGVEVEAVGAGVTHVAAGDRCCVEPYLDCGGCAACRRGLANCCVHNRTLGVHCDGGLRPRFTVPARKLHRSSRLTHAQNALVETLAIGCHAVDRGAAGPDDTTLVIGAGPIGLAVVECARLAGGRVIVMDRVPARLEFVRTRLGVADTLLATDPADDEAAVRGLTDGDLCGLVVDATGNAASMARALSLAGPGGRVVYVGITSGEIAFPHAPVMHSRELSIVASRNARSGDFTRIIGLIETGRIDTRPWITHEIPFADTIRAFPRLLEPDHGVIKAVVTVAPTGG